MSAKKVIVTGGAGFIGSNLVRKLCQNPENQLTVIDKMTYAGHKESIEDLLAPGKCELVVAGIEDQEKMQQLFSEIRPHEVYHLAAESHVDRSIDGPDDFIETNIMGTFSLLKAFQALCKDASYKEQSKFLHVSTDEVFGTLGDTGLFSETTPYAPNSPYSASKASSDFLVRAWKETFDLPLVITNCSNNYGPYQFPEKLIPFIILSALSEKPLQVYGDGKNVRDWLHVEDHADALMTVMEKGECGETYNIGSNNEQQNIDIVRMICGFLDEMAPRTQGKYEDLIQFVKDRPGHDRRYAIDCSKIEKQLGWTAKTSFADGLRQTVEWYRDQKDGWCAAVLKDTYDLSRQGSKS